MTSSADTDSTGPDIVAETLRRVRARGFSEKDAQEVEAEMKAEFGGQRVRIPKRKKHPSPEQRKAIFDEAIGCTDSDKEITSRHGISRRSLYNYIKRAGQ